MKIHIPEQFLDADVVAEVAPAPVDAPVVDVPADAPVEAAPEVEADEPEAAA